MAEQHRVSRKEQERKKGWIGIAVWIIAAVLLVFIIKAARSIGRIEGTRYYIYFEDSVAGLLPNSKVKYRGVEAGRVVGIRLSDVPMQLSPDGTSASRSSTPLVTPVVEVEIAVTNGQVGLNQNSRAYLKTNPLSGMQQIDINDIAARRGAEIKGEGAALREVDLFAGNVDMASWFSTKTMGSKAGEVTAIDFRRRDGRTEAQVLVTLPYHLREIDASSLHATIQTSVGKGQAFLEIDQRGEGAHSYGVSAGELPGQLIVTAPAAAIGIDPVIYGDYAAAPGGMATASAFVTRLEQDETIGTTGAPVKFLRVSIEGAIHPMVVVENRGYTTFLTLERSLTRGDRTFVAEVLHEGDRLPEFAPIEVSRSPLTLLLERADLIAQFVDYLPAIARNVESASADLASITTEIKEGAVGTLQEEISETGDQLQAAVVDLRDKLLTRVDTLADELETQVRRVGDTTQTKLDQALPEETIERLKQIVTDVSESTENWKAGIAAARATFEQGKEIIGIKGEEGRSLAQTVDQLSGALQKLDAVLSDNANQFSTVLGALEETLRTLEKLASELRPR